MPIIQPHEHTILSPRKMIFFSCLILIIGLMALDFINPSLPYIMHDLAVSQDTTKGLIITYLIAMSVAQLFYGTYSDNHGRKPAICLAFAIAAGGCMLSAFSRDIYMLYLARFITAVGMAGTSVISRAIIADACPDEPMMKKAFSYFAMFGQISPAVAPFFGGVIQHYSSWRISFLVLTGINIGVLIFLYKNLPESHTIPKIKTKLTEQLRVYFALMKMRRFLFFSLLSSLVLMFTMGYYSLSPFIFYAMGKNSVVNGLMCLPYAAGLAAGAFILSTFLYRFDSKKILLISLYSYLGFFVAASVFSYFYSDLFTIGLFAFVVAFLCGIAAPLSLSLCLQGFINNRGAASALQAFIRYFFSGVGMLCCNFIQISQLYQLTLIFLGISVVILLIYGLEARDSATENV